MAISNQPKVETRARLKWATSKSIGGVTEIAVLAPIRKGCVPGERRTFEERLRFAIANLATRHQQGLPIELDRVSSIHFGRMIVIRPEQYLLYSNLTNVVYNKGSQPRAHLIGSMAPSQVPCDIDDYQEIEPPPPTPTAKPRPKRDPELRSWLLTLVEFDGDLKAYMREIAHFIGPEFDRIFENCEDYPKTQNFELFWAWIRSFQITTDLFYATCPHISAVRIRELEAFKLRFDAFVARVRSATGPLVRSMDELFDEFLRENQQHGSGFPSPGGLYASNEDCHGG